MNIRDAILKAADQIERHPERFDFNSTYVPDIGRLGCGAPGCALGWIAHFYYQGGYTGNEYRNPKRYVGYTAGLEALKSDPDKPESFYNELGAFSPDWRGNATSCARALRLYADKYHPTTVADPDEVVA